MPRGKRRNAYQHASDFDRGRIVTYQDCGLSYHCNDARVGWDSMTVCRLWNHWVEVGNTEHRDEFKRPAITTSRVYRHLTRRDLMVTHVTSDKSNNGIVGNTWNVCTNSSTTSAAARNNRDHGFVSLTLRHSQEHFQCWDQ